MIIHFITTTINNHNKHNLLIALKMRGDTTINKDYSQGKGQLMPTFEIDRVISTFINNLTSLRAKLPTMPTPENIMNPNDQAGWVASKECLSRLIEEVFANPSKQTLARCHGKDSSAIVMSEVFAYLTQFLRSLPPEHVRGAIQSRFIVRDYSNRLRTGDCGVHLATQLFSPHMYTQADKSMYKVLTVLAAFEMFWCAQYNASEAGTKYNRTLQHTPDSSLNEIWHNAVIWFQQVDDNAKTGRTIMDSLRDYDATPHDRRLSVMNTGMGSMTIFDASGKVKAMTTESTVGATESTVGATVSTVDEATIMDITAGPPPYTRT